MIFLLLFLFSRGAYAGGGLYCSLPSGGAKIPQGYGSGPLLAISAGKFLVASRQLDDPVFGKSVILLISYDASGAMGLIVNRPSKLPLAELFPKVRGLRRRSDLIYIGGPVQMDRLFLLLVPPSPKVPHGRAVRIFGDVYLSADMDTFRKMAASGKARFRMYAGYAGWAAGQLESEISRGNWYLATADAATIFSEPPESIWPDLIQRAGFEVRLQGKRQKPGFFPATEARLMDFSPWSRSWSFQKSE